MSDLHLPQERRIDTGKLVDYLLHPEKGHGKAQLFYKLGFTIADWQVLRDALLAHAKTMPVTEIVASVYGTKYIVSGGLDTPDGRKPLPNVRAVWIQDEGQDGVRLVTVYPQRN